LLCHFFLNLSKTNISENLRVLARIFALSFFLAVIVLPAGLDLSGRIETEQ